jgi:hypothetical protein
MTASSNMHICGVATKCHTCEGEAWQGVASVATAACPTCHTTTPLWGVGVGRGKVAFRRQGKTGVANLVAATPRTFVPNVPLGNLRPPLLTACRLIPMA